MGPMHGRRARRPKVIHDCRWIADLLWHQHEISLTNVFDTQVANAFVGRNLGGGKWPRNVENLPDCLNNYLNLSPEDANFLQTREHSSEENDILWLVRPLPSELLDTSRKNTVYLLRLQRVLLAEMLVDFKAAVDIYLNCSSETLEDVEKCRVNRHLLPLAFTYIHTYVKKKSESRGLTMDPPGPSRPDFVTSPGKKVTFDMESSLQGNQNLAIVSQDSRNIQSKPFKAQAPANTKKKPRPKRGKQLSHKAKGNKEMSRDALPNEGSSSFQIELEGRNTDIVGYNNDSFIDMTAELEYAILDSPNGESDNADSFMDVDYVCPTSLNTDGLPSVSVPWIVPWRVDQEYLLPKANSDKGEPNPSLISITPNDSRKDQEDQELKQAPILPTPDFSRLKKSELKDTLTNTKHLNEKCTVLQKQSLKSPAEPPASSTSSCNFEHSQTISIASHPPASLSTTNKKDAQSMCESTESDPGDEGMVKAAASLPPRMQETQLRAAGSGNPEYSPEGLIPNTVTESLKNPNASNEKEYTVTGTGQSTVGIYNISLSQEDADTTYVVRPQISVDAL
ncbi:exonuclease 3'-5' domain-containing protein 1 [Elysia marginata]|uniref:Exonuclease 3'-5' domain-containing protein 1 n=1 Tax=Elysia marginata TaxID=1093978 RepID=A0AAV4FLG5_9GAST|nr:exonuclease 3'-5' domain-containing protein 1 [Elysia marginata]